LAVIFAVTLATTMTVLRVLIAAVPILRVIYY